MPPEVRDWEPHLALTPGGDGLDAYRAIAAGRARASGPGGRLLVEIGPTQGAAVSASLPAAGLDRHPVLPDLDGRDRVIVAARALIAAAHVRDKLRRIRHFRLPGCGTIPLVSTAMPCLLRHMAVRMAFRRPLQHTPIASLELHVGYPCWAQCVGTQAFGQSQIKSGSKDKMRSSKSRSRSKSNRPRTLGNIVNRVFDSSGPDGKVRGTPQQIIEKYQLLARDAQLSNDRVAAENFQQHAEHYTRMLAEAQRELAAEQETRRQPAAMAGRVPDSGKGQTANQTSAVSTATARTAMTVPDPRDATGPSRMRPQPRGPMMIGVSVRRAKTSALVETPEARSRPDTPRPDYRDRAPRRPLRPNGRTRSERPEPPRTHARTASRARDPRENRKPRAEQADAPPRAPRLRPRRASDRRSGPVQRAGGRSRRRSRAGAGRPGRGAKAQPRPRAPRKPPRRGCGSRSRAPGPAEAAE